MSDNHRLIEGDGLVNNFFYFLWKRKADLAAGANGTTTTGTTATNTTSNNNNTNSAPSAAHMLSANPFLNGSSQAPSGLVSHLNPESSVLDGGCDFHVPSTVIFEHNYPKAWYYSHVSSGGGGRRASSNNDDGWQGSDLERKLGKDIDSASILKDFCPKSAALMERARNAAEGKSGGADGSSGLLGGGFGANAMYEKYQDKDIVAAYFSIARGSGVAEQRAPARGAGAATAQPDASPSTPSKKHRHRASSPTAASTATILVEYLNEPQLRDLLLRRTKREDGLLQRWVWPSGKQNSVIQAIWTPHMCLVSRRKNIHAVRDVRAPMHDRAVTYEGPSHLSAESYVAPHVHWQIERNCQGVVRYMFEAHRMAIRRMVLHFKVDQESRVWFLWASSVRVQESVQLNLTVTYLSREQYALTQAEGCASAAHKKGDENEDNVKESNAALKDQAEGHRTGLGAPLHSALCTHRGVPAVMLSHATQLIRELDYHATAESVQSTGGPPSLDKCEKMAKFPKPPSMGPIGPIYTGSLVNPLATIPQPKKSKKKKRRATSGKRSTSASSSAGGTNVAAVSGKAMQEARLPPPPLGALTAPPAAVQRQQQQQQENGNGGNGASGVAHTPKRPATARLTDAVHKMNNNNSGATSTSSSGGRFTSTMKNMPTSVADVVGSLSERIAAHHQRLNVYHFRPHQPPQQEPQPSLGTYAGNNSSSWKSRSQLHPQQSLMQSQMSKGPLSRDHTGTFNPAASGGGGSRSFVSFLGEPKVPRRPSSATSTSSSSHPFESPASSSLSVSGGKEGGDESSPPLSLMMVPSSQRPSTTTMTEVPTAQHTLPQPVLTAAAKTTKPKRNVPAGFFWRWLRTLVLDGTFRALFAVQQAGDFFAELSYMLYSHYLAVDDAANVLGTTTTKGNNPLRPLTIEVSPALERGIASTIPRNHSVMNNKSFTSSTANTSSSNATNTAATKDTNNRSFNGNNSITANTSFSSPPPITSATYKSLLEILTEVHIDVMPFEEASLRIAAFKAQQSAAMSTPSQSPPRRVSAMASVSTSELPTGGSNIATPGVGTTPHPPYLSAEGEATPLSDPTRVDPLKKFVLFGCKKPVGDSVRQLDRLLQAGLVKKPLAALTWRALATRYVLAKKEYPFKQQ